MYVERAEKSKVRSDQAGFEKETDILIEEAKCEIRAEFDKRMTSYNTETTPIDVKSASEILKDLLQLALAKRRNFPQRLGNVVERGEILQEYCDKLREIDALTEDAYIRLKQAQFTRERFAYEKALFDNVIKEVYEIPPDSEQMKKIREQEDILEDSETFFDNVYEENEKRGEF